MNGYLCLEYFVMDLTFQGRRDTKYQKKLCLLAVVFLEMLEGTAEFVSILVFLPT